MVVAAALSADQPTATTFAVGRLPTPSARVSRASMVISFFLHGVALLLLISASGPGSTAPADEPVFLVELALAAPAPAQEPSPEPQSAESPAAQPQAAESPSMEALPEASPVEASGPTQPQIPMPAPAMPPEPEIVLDLPRPEEPPPLNMAELKPPDPPKLDPPKLDPPKPSPPKPPAVAAPAVQTTAAKPAPPKPAAKAPAATQTASPPDRGTAETTRTAAATLAAAIVWEDRPRFHSPPTPAVFPPHAIELGQQGEARVRVRLDPDGSAAEILLWRGTGFDLLDRAALAAVRGWRFLPAMRDGRAVAAWVEIPVRFHLH